jgi:hypothetical protein
MGEAAVRRGNAEEAELQVIPDPVASELIMPIEHMIVFFGGALIAMILSMKSYGRGVRLQQDILARGILTQARVVHLWQPPLTGAFTRIYFEFAPGDAEPVIRTCHIDRRGSGDWNASLPHIGAEVAVRYLPGDPAQAVIVKLVSRLAH